MESEQYYLRDIRDAINGKDPSMAGVSGESRERYLKDIAKAIRENGGGGGDTNTTYTINKGVSTDSEFELAGSDNTYKNFASSEEIITFDPTTESPQIQKNLIYNSFYRAGTKLQFGVKYAYGLPKPMPAGYKPVRGVTVKENQGWVFGLTVTDVQYKAVFTQEQLDAVTDDAPMIVMSCYESETPDNYVAMALVKYYDSDTDTYKKGLTMVDKENSALYARATVEVVAGTEYSLRMQCTGSSEKAVHCNVDNTNISFESYTGTRVLTGDVLIKIHEGVNITRNLYLNIDSSYLVNSIFYFDDLNAFKYGCYNSYGTEFKTSDAIPSPDAFLDIWPELQQAEISPYINLDGLSKHNDNQKGLWLPFGLRAVSLTQAEYDALTTAEKMDATVIYFVN